MQMSALCASIFTSAILPSSAQIAGSCSLESTVTEMLTSLVDTMSIAQLVLVEDIEDSLQVAVRHQHTAGHHVYDGQPLLRRDCS